MTLHQHSEAKARNQHGRPGDEVTETFEFLATYPFEHLDSDSEHFQRIERLVVVLYSKTCSLTSVNGAREDFLPQEQKNGHDTTNTRCPSATCSTNSILSWSMDHQYSGTSDDSIFQRFWLVQGSIVTVTCASLDNHSRGI